MILYFNHQYIDHPTVQNLLQQTNSDVLQKLLNFRLYDRATASFYNRKGTNFLPTKYNIENLPGFGMPDVDPNFNHSWEQVSDQRCVELRKTHFDRPWTVMWSGGIDSTVIMASIIKNLATADYQNITVACSAMSIWENPQFYFNYIKPNFKTVHSEWAISKEAIDQEVYMIDGEPADQLFGGMGVAPDLIFQDASVMKKNIRTHKDDAINFLSRNTDRKFAEWYYNVVITNAGSAGVEINTLHDMIWWIAFNHTWTSVKFRFLHFGHWKNIKNAGFFLDKFIHWFDSNNYQAWALHNQITDQKINQTAAEYKLAAKKYIYSLDQNKYYYTYKTKTASGDISHLNRKPLPDWASNKWFRPSPWCCIDQDLNLLNFELHTEQIKKQLIDHFLF